MEIDRLLGAQKAAGSTPLELATMADIGAEIGARENSQPAIFVYDHGDGRWPCRMGPNVSADVLRKIAKILMSIAEQKKAMEGGECGPASHGDDPTVKLPWGTFRRVRDWSDKRDRVLAERNFELVLARSAWPWFPFAVGVLCGLLAAAAAKFVFNLWG